MSRRTKVFFRVAVLVAVGLFLYIRIAAHQSTLAAWGGWHAALEKADVRLWTAMLLLAALNWGIEAAKWRLLMTEVQPMGRLRAFSATLAGTAIGMFTPNRTGEFVGRVLFLAPENRWRGGFASVLGSIAQFAITVIAGGTAFVLWLPQRAVSDGGHWPSLAMAAVVSLVAIATLIFYFQPRLLQQVVAKLPLIRRLGKEAAVLDKFPLRISAMVLALSGLRYAIFMAQYMVLLTLVAVVPLATSLLAVPLIFLTTTLVPTMLLTELGVRGSVAVVLLVPALQDPSPVLLAALMLWAVNLALPAVVGGFILLSQRIRGPV
ncbi:MAG: flippase-like domain-containing protein [Flavobacteriales bacterium]|nr:flippase-like domain-containing protein [Flavobacteriales bacterium]